MSFEQLCGRCHNPGVVGARRIDGRMQLLCTRCIDEIDRPAVGAKLRLTPEQRLANIRASQRKYRKAHAEENREYQREYHRRLRQKVRPCPTT